MSSLFTLPDRVRCGMVVPGGERDAVLEHARGIEAAGFDSLWVGDHVSFHIPILDSLSVLSFCAAATERIALGTSVYLVPLRHPTLVAKISATVDRLSGGRLVLGIGVGGEFPPEFEAVGVPVEERGPRTDEGLEVIRRLWREDAVEHAGRFFRFGPVSLDPKPVQPQGPPILVGGRKGPSFRRAGRAGDGYISHMCSAEHFAQNMQAIEAHAREAGREGDAFEPASFIFSVFGDDFESAHERASAMLGRIYNTDFREASKRYCLLGRPEDCLEQLQPFVRAGTRHVILSPLSDPVEARERAQGFLPDLANLL